MTYLFGVSLTELQNRPDYHQTKNGKLKKPQYLVAYGTTSHKSNEQAAETRCGTGHNLFFPAHSVVIAHLYPTGILAIFLRTDHALPRASARQSAPRKNSEPGVTH
ncbi:MAG: hypothetical protein HY937_03600 [Nitrosomonadales bacterium]|nr:hypothetical protein [Nitrosomonadales bacterium]